MGRFANYMSLPICTEDVTTHCADTSYVNETVIPAQKELFVAQGELEAAVDADGYVDGEIKERAETAVQTLVDIASGETIVNAINEEKE